MQKSYVSRAGKVRHYDSSGQMNDLENHFILRLPKHQARVLREDIKEGKTNIKDRLFIQLDHTQSLDDMRNGIITFDTIMYKARLVDLPSISETYKTIDGKNFYKTADVCQMLKVVDNDEPQEEEETKKKKRDPNKLDRKYYWPHGYTPPLKNLRKRRFRKMLRKKGTNIESLDMADIEKEVRRLLRTDNEAASFRFEVLREDELVTNNATNTNASESNLDKEELFGELSSSDDEMGANINIIDDDDDDSRMSVDDSRSFVQNEAANSPKNRLPPISESGEPLVTEFTPGMFSGDSFYNETRQPTSFSRSVAAEDRKLPDKSQLSPDVVNELYARLSYLESDLARLMSLKGAQENEISTLENVTLKQKLLEKLSALQEEICAKENEIKEIRNRLI